MDKYTANRYIWLKQQIAAGGGSVPQELIDEVNALDATVNGDETQDPPVIGLVDIVGDLENELEDLDLTVNGDSTTTPETPGLVDRVENLELSVNGDPESVPPILPSVGNVRISLLWSNSDPTQTFAAQNIELSSGDYDMLIVIFKYNTIGSDMSVICKRGDNCLLSGTTASTNGVVNSYRVLTYTNNTNYVAGDGYLGVGSQSQSVSNTSAIPYQIYGIKLI